MMRTTTLLTLLCALAATPAVAQTVVSDDRLSLPDGPGSLEGLGDNAAVDGNMGLMRWSLPIAVPPGHRSMTPEVDLRYSSGNGNSVVGIGWSLREPYIERLTIRGLPSYAPDDEFTTADGEQLVRVVDSDPPVYRSRFEKAFVRYKWMNAADGREGYWVAEYPDGRVGYFGADADGELVDSARVAGRDGTFRYHLVEVRDPFGHLIRYRYDKSANVAYCASIGYVYASGAPRYAVELEYEDRPDRLNDCKSGRCERIERRLAAIDVRSNSERIRRYVLVYDDATEGLIVSRLVGVTQLGLGDVVYPGVFSFGYSRSLGASCEGCVSPYLVSMGSLGLDVAAGTASLVDMTGDGLPDVVNSGLEGPHRIHINRMDADGRQYFDAPTQSAEAASSSSKLDSSFVQILDADGDGFADLVDAINGVVLKNFGLGDWAAAQSIDTSGFPDFGEDANLRFLDYDNDRRIDVVQSDATTTQFWRNLGAGEFASVGVSADSIGAGFVENGLRLEELNGDGLLDAAIVADASIAYRPNLGMGQWGPWTEMANVPNIPANQMRLVDLNGDSLVDVVAVRGRAVQYALNRSGDGFLPLVEITNAGADALPEASADVTVLFADMNGNGSEDAVWITRSGEVTYLELFPVRPNLLTRIENGLGMVTDVTYSTSVMQRAAGPAWSHAVPHPMIVVERLDAWDALTEVHEVTTLSYRDGFYDGVEKQFRGYAHVTSSLAGDESVEPGTVTRVYDVGATDTYFNGLLLEESETSAGAALKKTTNRYEDCPVDGVPVEGLRFDVRHVCRVATEVVLQEGLERSAWVTTETSYVHDGYGNVTAMADLGVTKIGDEGCGACARDASAFGEACGAACLGDERFVETTYVEPDSTGGRWILGAESRVRTFGEADGAVYGETTTYYDGEDFVGLAAGALTQGKVTRRSSLVEAGRTIDVERSRHDAHGNVVETLDPLGTPGAPGHRRVYTMTDDGLRVARLEIPLDGYTLRRERTYDPVFDEVAEATSWMIVEGGAVQTARNSDFFAYDAFGRIDRIVRPGGDTLDAPTERYDYQLGAPVSRIAVERRSVAGGPVDLESSRCIDGRGRLVQAKDRLAEDRYQADGFVVRNVRGGERRVYQPYVTSTGACDLAPPSDVASVATTYDATSRVRTVLHPDDDVYDRPSTEEIVYTPLETIRYDGEDADPSSPHFDTPTVVVRDGLGRTVAIERNLAGESVRTRFSYDALGHLRGYVDAAGHEKVQSFDLLGRVWEVSDPNAGQVRFAHDDAGNRIATTDGRGVTVRTVYDGMNRPIERFDAANEAATKIRWQYDRDPDCAACTNGEGRLVHRAYPAGLDTVGYDPRGRRVLERRTIDGHRFETTTAYDNVDRTLAMTYPDGRTRTRAYDGSSRVVAIDGVVPTLGYDDRGLLETVAFADGSSRRRSYDRRRRLAELTSLDGGGAVLQSYVYDRDREGNIREVDVSGRAAFAEHGRARYTYDDWYRPTLAALGSSALDGGVVETTYAYDVIDNVLEQRTNAGAAPYRYGGEAGPNAVVEANGRSYAYDAAGQVTTRGAQSLEWDFLGRLTRVDEAGRDVERSVYGADHVRVTKTEGDSVTYYVTSSFDVRDGVAVIYDRLNGVRLSEDASTAFQTEVFDDLAPASAPDGVIRASDAWMRLSACDADCDAGPVLAGAARRLLTDERPAFVHPDHLGSTRLLTRDGDVDAEVALSTFGAQAAHRGSTPTFTFTGQERDASGLDHFAFRTYDPTVGRWMSPDPLFLVLTTAQLDKHGEATTAYAYVGNRPTAKIDPLGLTGGNSNGSKGSRGSKGSKGSKSRRSSSSERKRAAKGKQPAKTPPSSDSGSSKSSGSWPSSYFDKKFDHKAKGPPSEARTRPMTPSEASHANRDLRQLKQHGDPSRWSMEVNRPPRRSSDGGSSGGGGPSGGGGGGGSGGSDNTSTGPSLSSGSSSGGGGCFGCFGWFRRR
ncbi:MAG: SpvB/TcaC N-terminal domain-containing protein [Deltaproteobacteria bacterium]